MKDFITFPRKGSQQSAQGMRQPELYRRSSFNTETARLHESPELPKISPQGLCRPGVQEVVILRNALYQMVLTSGWLDGHLRFNIDLFGLGLDSLQTLALSKQINTYLMRTMPTVKTITPRTIYTHSSIVNHCEIDSGLDGYS